MPLVHKRSISANPFSLAIVALALVGCTSSPGSTGSSPSSSNGSDDPSVDAAIVWAADNLPNLTPEVIRAAAEEGEVHVVLHNFGDAAVAELHAKFQERFPFITVHSTAQQAAQVIQRFEAEVGANRGEGDVFLAGNPAIMPDLISRGVVANFTISDDSAYGDGLKEPGYWYTFHDIHGATVYRTDALTAEEIELIRTWEGVADPRFNGRVGGPDVATGGYALGASFMAQRVLPDPVWEGLEANGLVVRSGLSPTLDGMLAGEYDMVIMASLVTASNLAREGAPIEFVETSPVLASPVPQFISAIAPHANAARVYQDWSLSQEAQSLWTGLSGVPSGRSDTEDNRWYLSEPWWVGAEEVLILDWGEVTEAAEEVVAEFDRAFK